MEAHRNNIGFLRLVFASLVIVGHAPEMMDGSRVREPLTMLTGTLSLGQLSVDAFFLLSGYLIAKSAANGRSMTRYLERRVMRIYPAFILAYLLSVFVLGTVGHAQPWLELPKTFVRMLLLQDPSSYPGLFPGMAHYQALNGAMWTIAYEFRCYLLIALLWALGLLARGRVIVALAAAVMALSIGSTFVAGDGSPAPSRVLVLLFGDPVQTARLTAAFLIGTCFFVYRDAIGPWLTGRAAAICGAAALALTWHNPHFAEAALVTFGAVTLFWLAFKANLGPVQRINDRWDISYGVYLYGWPVATWIRWEWPGISPWVLALVTLPIAFALGAASWWGLEKWAKGWSPTGALRRADPRAGTRHYREPDGSA